MSLWNFTLNDTSPVFSYRPYADGSSAQDGWQLFYTSSGFNTHTGESGQGDSFHVTSLSGAQVTLGFRGTAVYLYGSSNASYDVTLDGNVQSFSPASGLLYSSNALTEDDHSVTITARPSSSSQVLEFGSAIVSISSPAIPIPKVIDNSDAALGYYGSWTTATAQGVPNSTVSLPFHQTLTISSGFTVQLPASTVAVALYGSTNFGHRLYSVSMDGQAPQTLNGSTNWLVGDALVYFEAGMDANSTHMLNATNLSSGGAKFTLSRVVAYQSDANASAQSTKNPQTPTKSKGKVNVGAIVGPIVGVFMFLVLLWLYTRVARMRRQMSGVDAAPGKVDPLVLPPSGGRAQTQRTGEKSGLESGLELSSRASEAEVLSGSTRTGDVSWASTTMTATATTGTSPRLGGVSHAKNGVTVLSAANGAPQTQTQPRSAADSESQASSSPTPGLPPGVDVDRIIELIAQRIDQREPGHGATQEDELAPPPEYRTRAPSV